ncbi:hypothetical protein GGR53DRAFT_480438 [Hypoxylon sp. FL1150]|nr:hypothetical protein GGR53DRAFT_480438 [Hypoxylon sp. FL1150]
MYSTKQVLPGTGLEAVPNPNPVAPEALYSQQFQWDQNAKPQWLMPAPAESSVPNEKHADAPRIAGFRRTTFFLLIALCVVIALVIGLGAGLGVEARNSSNRNTSTSADNVPVGVTMSVVTTSTLSSLTSEAASSSSSSSSTSSSSTSTSLAVSAITAGAIAVSGCPGRNDSSMTEAKLTYKIYCDTDLTGDPTVNTVLGSFEECLQLCDSLNSNGDRDDIGCVFNESGINNQTPGSCWCKGGAGVQIIRNTGIMVGTPVS